MGLCKCPKRKVTNLFCFEHRVNVCEHCLVANHAKVGRAAQLPETQHLLATSAPAAVAPSSLQPTWLALWPLR
uniref:Zinc finger protein-like 1 n=1 Tax=Bos mutus grunniens TaxID=30521 RepID=A0A8B9YX76_BOSMU